MPQPRVLLDYQRCDPWCSEDGVCPAVLVCEKKVLRQEVVGEPPEIYTSRCLGCVDCLTVCPNDALQLMK
jgi:formate hydrogenlyase subunit 6/NADH:ubiquinone oxidoreductase subunit I